MYQNFEYYTPTKVIFGKETELRTGELIREQGSKKVLIHFGGKSAARSGLLDRIRHSLEEAGISWAALSPIRTFLWCMKESHSAKKKALTLFLLSGEAA